MIALTLCVTGLVALAAEGDKKKKPADNPGTKALQKYDKNSNGKIDDDEREAMRKDRQAEALKKYDKNNDGKLDAAEREAAKADRRKPAEGKKPVEKKVK